MRFTASTGRRGKRYDVRDVDGVARLDLRAQEQADAIVLSRIYRFLSNGRQGDEMLEEIFDEAANTAAAALD